MDSNIKSYSWNLFIYSQILKKYIYIEVAHKSCNYDIRQSQGNNSRLTCSLNLSEIGPIVVQPKEIGVDYNCYESFRSLFAHHLPYHYVMLNFLRCCFFLIVILSSKVNGI
jgi:hypothetical protein